MSEHQDKIYWHDAICEALELDLYEYKNGLQFEDKWPLSKEALEIDVVIIKKEKNLKIEKEFGRIFRGHNVFEYKSPTDYLSISDYNKVFGYAFLYSAFENVPIKDITISFIATKYPRELIKYLKNERGLEVIEMVNGIHFVNGDLMPVQILERRKLSKEDNLFLRNLTSNLSTEDMVSTLKAYENKKELNPKSVYLDRLLKANWQIFKEVASMNITLKELFLESAEEEGWAEDLRIRDRKRLAIKMLADGESVDKIIKWTELSKDIIIGLKNEVEVTTA